MIENYKYYVVFCGKTTNSLISAAKMLTLQHGAHFYIVEINEGYDDDDDDDVR